MIKMELVYIVYELEDWSNAAVFSQREFADAWIARQPCPEDYYVECLPLDMCVDGYDVYNVVHCVSENSWNVFKQNTSQESEGVYHYDEGAWWAISIRDKSPESALERGKALIGEAINELL